MSYNPIFSGLEFDIHEAGNLWDENKPSWMDVLVFEGVVQRQFVSTKMKLQHYLRHSWLVSDELLPTLPIKPHSGQIFCQREPS